MLSCVTFLYDKSRLISQTSTKVKNHPKSLHFFFKMAKLEARLKVGFLPNVHCESSRFPMRGGSKKSNPKPFFECLKCNFGRVDMILRSGGNKGLIITRKCRKASKRLDCRHEKRSKPYYSYGVPSITS